MKLTVKKLFLTTLAALAFSLSAHAQNKMAVVDLKKVFDGYWRTKQADTQLKERASDFEKARTGMLEDYKKVSEDFKKMVESANDQAVSADERDKRKKDAEKKRGEIAEIENSIRTFDNNSRQSILDQQKRMRESVLRDIRGVVEEKSKAAGYGLVVDTAAESLNQTPVVLYTSLLGSADDLTEGVLKQLNANAPADAAATPAAEEKK
jgi:outer membrane protein